MFFNVNNNKNFIPLDFTLKRQNLSVSFTVSDSVQWTKSKLRFIDGLPHSKQMQQF